MAVPHRTKQPADFKKIADPLSLLVYTSHSNHIEKDTINQVELKRVQKQTELLRNGPSTSFLPPSHALVLADNDGYRAGGINKQGKKCKVPTSSHQIDEGLNHRGGSRTEPTPHQLSRGIRRARGVGEYIDQEST